MIRVFVLSPVTYRAFQKYFPSDFPAEALLHEQHQHRYMTFVEHLGWRSGNIYRDDNEKIECDDFDRENTIYSIAVDEDNNFLGSVRAYSTMHPYMLELDEFARTIPSDFSLPKHPDIFEGSRIINPNSKLMHEFNGTNHRKVGAELLITHMELGRALGITEYIATMPPELLYKAYGRMGWDIEEIGSPVQIQDNEGHLLDKGVATQHYIYRVDSDLERKIRETTGFTDQVSHFGVPEDVLPDLLAHMCESALEEHPHRFPKLAEGPKWRPDIQPGTQKPEEVPPFLRRGM